MVAKNFSQLGISPSPRRELLGVPIIGVILAAFAWRVSQEPGIPTLLTDLIYALSAFVFLGGIALYFRAPPRFSLQGEEEIVYAFHPRIILGYMMMAAGLPLIAASIYVYEYTLYPYIFVFIPLLLGLYLLISGFFRYWRNTITTYYITTERVIRANRFLSMDTHKLEIEKISSEYAGRRWYTGLLGIQQARFSTDNDSLRLRDSPAAIDVVGKLRTVKKELRSQRVQEDARVTARENARATAEILRDALGDSIGVDREEWSDSRQSRQENETHSNRGDDPNSQNYDSIQRTDNERMEQNSQSGPAGDSRESSNVEQNPAVEDGTEPGNNRSAADMLDVDKAKQRLDRYVAEWSENNCQTEHHRELINHQAEQLENAGIEVTIPKIGSEFNPAHHRCTSHIPSPEPEDTIILVDQVGLYGEGVRKRDALVVTSSGPD